MKIVILLLLAIMLFGVFRTHRSVRQSATPAERSAAVRISAFAWLAGLLFLIAFIFLPNKQRAILLLPGVFFAVSFARFWHNKRTRLRRENDERVNLDRMKRVN